MIIARRSILNLIQNNFRVGIVKQLEFPFSNQQKDDNSSKMNLQKIQDKEKQGYVAKMREEIIQNAIVASLQEKSKIKAKEEYRAAILFEEVLNREIDINLYDTKGRAYFAHTLWNIFGVLFAGFGMYTIFQNQLWYSKKMEIFKILIATGFIFTRFLRQRQFYKYQVEQVIYNTKSKNFTITKRNIIGLKRRQELQKDQILYTADRDLNQKKINYININTLECYGIGFDYAWIKKDLFSHLIQQNIS